MCRINGIIKFGSSPSEIDISSVGLKLRDELSHGGPDDSGCYITEERNLFLGHRRLSILDTSVAGHQPMEFNNWVIVYNGEVYNFKSVRKELIDLGYNFITESDTEVILKAFDCWGKDSLSKFRGMFAFALWNKISKKLLLCRDRLGVKPLYYYLDKHNFIFASELDGIANYPGLNLEIDHTSVSLYLQVGYIKSPYSIYKNIKKLEPGSFLEIDLLGSKSIASYWVLNNIGELSVPKDDVEILEKANQLLIENCNLRMVADVPVGVFLSGGIDSSLVTSILSQDLNYSVKTFSIGFENKDFDESTHAKLVADRLATEHDEWILNDNDFKNALDEFYNVYDEPFGDSSGIPTYLLSRFARKQVTVALSADGGDEIFGGYDRYNLVKSIYPKINRIPTPLRKMIADVLLQSNSHLVKSVFKLLSGQKENSSIDWRLPKLLNLLSTSSFMDCYSKTLTTIPDSTLMKLHNVPREFTLNEEMNWYDPSLIISSLGKVDAGSYLEGDILTKVDRATMAVALEGREPLLDHTLVEFGLSLPDQYKIRNGKNKWILRTLLEQRLPKELIDRPKKGFGVPIHQWMNSTLKESILEMTYDSQFHKQFLFDGKILQQLISHYFSGKRFINPHFIWNLHMLYIWYQKKLKHA